MHYYGCAVDDMKDNCLVTPGSLAQSGIGAIAQMKLTHSDTNAAAEAFFRVNLHAPRYLGLSRAQQLMQGFDKTGIIRFVENRTILGGQFPGEQKIGKFSTRKPTLATVGIGQKLLQFVFRRHLGHPLPLNVRLGPDQKVFRTEALVATDGGD